MTIINPHELFGINKTKKELKNKYYELALLCHPDNGGNKDEMILLHNSYIYLKNNITTNFNLYHKNNNFYPELKKIYKLTSKYDSNNKFNKKFNKSNNIKLNNIKSNNDIKLNYIDNYEYINNNNNNDYSSISFNKNIYMSDYKLAFSENHDNKNIIIKNRTLDELIKEREL